MYIRLGDSEKRSVETILGVFAARRMRAVDVTTGWEETVGYPKVLFIQFSDFSKAKWP